MDMVLKQLSPTRGKRSLNNDEVDDYDDYGSGSSHNRNHYSSSDDEFEKTFPDPRNHLFMLMIGVLVVIALLICLIKCCNCFENAMSPEMPERDSSWYRHFQRPYRPTVALTEYNTALSHREQLDLPPSYVSSTSNSCNNLMNEADGLSAQILSTNTPLPPSYEQALDNMADGAVSLFDESNNPTPKGSIRDVTARSTSGANSTEIRDRLEEVGSADNRERTDDTSGGRSDGRREANHRTSEGTEANTNR